ncbi:unconventional prefoldin RPB5 interactor-like protein [Cephus cinctus]|uniref:Unconventional prefoldin RPB5 interactor-like protein n=1 Tax=Cephus cinctus TaxID=211228 RepID=A0AAJ7BRE7_CEPCN|nr:unconventional prefoldin RPB5 interactor-like protein [Cephus cinctus]XP_015592576.1 unconventional prefoldin RPB5 interactor-like protein [Cephus cinctus]XP_015592577.1 unconventional prefoldin RPB5 interactor-like protein [Cephus cinctus]XP_024939535.1 unconventional prefoldin RPB5 interactor-like protein [Cephus cinctus]
MDYQQLHLYQQSLLNQALTEGIKRNEEQSKVWSAYKERHKKIISGLEILPLELSTNCMVPIGKRALMKGKLVHTNEILICLGEGYFAKYTAAQAIALCNRRIKKSDDMLLNLEKERNLYEMRQILPLEQDVFGDGDRKDLVEHWDEQKLEDWRVQHRQREKEYHKKLSELKKQEKKEIKTEEDLLHRLDELELQEELEAEIDRLQEGHINFYGEELEEGEVYDESEEEEESSSDEATNEMLERELEKLQEIRIQKKLAVPPDSSLNVTDKKKQKEAKNIDDTFLNESPSIIINEILGKPPAVSKAEFESVEPTNEIREQRRNRERKVSFVEPYVQEKNNDDDETPLAKERRVSFIEQRLPSEDDSTEDFINEENEKEDDETIQIHFKHSDIDPQIAISAGNVIENPRDVYRLFDKPKSILKRSPNDLCAINNVSSLLECSADQEIEEDNVLPGASTYSIVVKDIQERKLEDPKTELDYPTDKPRRVSKFKLNRSGIKN